MAEHKRQDVQGAMFGKTQMVTVKLKPSKSRSGDAGTLGKVLVSVDLAGSGNNGDRGRDEQLGSLGTELYGGRRACMLPRPRRNCCFVLLVARRLNRGCLAGLDATLGTRSTAPIAHVVLC
jgi:hypothetical protein